MERIKNFCLEISCKVKDNITTVIATAIVSIFLLIISFVFKTYLTTVHTFTFPLWGWIVLCVVISCPLAITLKIIDLRRRKKVLTDADDIFIKLYWWLGQQREFVRKQTEDNKLVTWHFSTIDKELGLNPGSAEKVLPKMLNESPKLFPITLLKKGEKTIALRYGL